MHQLTLLCDCCTLGRSQRAREQLHPSREFKIEAIRQVRERGTDTRPSANLSP